MQTLQAVLVVALPLLAALALVHGALPAPYNTELLVEVVVAAGLAALLYAAAPRDVNGKVQLTGLALVCAPLCLSMIPGLRGRALLPLALGLAVSAWLRPDFWTGRSREGSASFRAALLALTLLQGLHLVRIGAGAVTSYDADGFYYYGLARHWVMVGRIEDHVLWHFLSPPADVVHPVGDYWQPMTSIVIAPAMWLLGPTHAAAGASVALFSLCGSVALWALLTGGARSGAGLVQHRAVQLAVLLAYNSNPALERFRIDAESQGVVSSFLLFAMLAMQHRRWGLAIALATCVAWTRSDASFSALALVAGCCIAATPLERRRVAVALCTAGALYVGSHLVRFGTLGPPAAARAPLLASYDDLYCFPPVLLDARTRWASISTSVPSSTLAVTSLLMRLPFVLVRGLGLMAAFAAWGACSRDRSLDEPRRAVVAASIVISLAVPLVLMLVAGPVFNNGRTLHGLIAAMHVATAYGADRVLASRSLPRVSALVGVAVVGVTLSWVPLAWPPTSQREALSFELRTLSPALEGHVVLTELSWWVGAETDAAGVVHTPLRSAAAVSEAITRWGPDLFLAEPRSVPPSLHGVVHGASFEVARLGPYTFVPLRRGQTYRLYRIVRDAP